MGINMVKDQMLLYQSNNPTTLGNYRLGNDKLGKTQSK